MKITNRISTYISFVLLSNQIIYNYNVVNSFCIKSINNAQTRNNINKLSLSSLKSYNDGLNEEENHFEFNGNNNKLNRRSMIQKAISTTTVGLLSSLSTNTQPANAAIGSMYEYSNTNAILQGITINVADISQQTSMINFLTQSFTGFKILRQGTIDSVTDTWVGFGPEELTVPKDYEFGVNSFAMYGGHASIHIRYDSQSSNVYFRGPGTDVLGDNIAFLQVGVESYKISKIQENNGNILDAFGHVNVISPVGLPVRAIVGIWPDPMMFIAINCIDVKESKSFYEQLGFTEQPYPYARPSLGTTPFEPMQPKKSSYLSPSNNGMGILLLPINDGSKKKIKNVTPNPVLNSLNIVYNPNNENSDSSSSNDSLRYVDPSGVPISFVSQNVFSAEERVTRIVEKKEERVTKIVEMIE